MHSESDGQHFYSRYLWLVVFVPSEDLEYVPWEMRKMLKFDYVDSLVTLSTIK